MNISITIPTIRNKQEIQPLIDELQVSISYTNRKSDFNVIETIASCKKVSASINRNWCIDNAKGDIIIMIDDDVHVVEQDWIIKLVKPLIEYQDKISIIAPRLTDRNKNPAPQLGNNGWYPLIEDKEYLKVATHTPETKLNVVCSACICFYKNNGVRFNENYPDACFEDTHYSMDTNKKFPNKKIIINESSKLMHLNEGKWRKGGTWHQNRAYFNKCWGTNL